MIWSQVVKYIRRGEAPVPLADILQPDISGFFSMNFGVCFQLTMKNDPIVRWFNSWQTCPQYILGPDLNAYQFLAVAKVTLVKLKVVNFP